jgi:hypothetical protein
MLRPIDSALALRRQGVAVEPLMFLVDGALALLLLGTAQALYVGRPWVRWVYAIGATLAVANALTPIAITLLLVIGSLASGGQSPALSTLHILHTFALPVACVVCAVVVWRSDKPLAGSALRAAPASTNSQDQEPSISRSRRPESQPRTVHQYVLCGALFTAVFAWQSMTLWRLIPFDRITNEHMHNFMLISMGLGFIPLGVALLVAVLVMFGMFLLAYLPAWLYWRSVGSPARSARSR